MVKLNKAEMWALAKCVCSMLADAENMKDLRASFSKIASEVYELKTEDIQDYSSLFGTLIEIPLDGIQNFTTDV